MARLAMDLEDLLGCSIDLGTARSLNADAAESAMRDMRAL
jgi:hypothetical protein